MNEVKFIGTNKALVTGFYGLMLMTTNAGLNWVSISSNTTADLYGISFINENTGYVSGESGTILRSTDGGFLWQPQSSGVGNRLESISFADANTGNAVGWGSVILRTTTGGNLWYQQASPIGNTTFESVKLTSPSTGVIVGGGGTILYTTTGGDPIGIEPISSNVPENYSLEQNYPNPFNPTTNFEFRIAKTGFVNLTIYDAMGRVVESLVNGELKPGTYKADWDASNYPSGVYFYTLNTGSFTETMKMVLLK